MASTERSRSTAGPMSGVQANPASTGFSTRSTSAGLSEITTRSTRSGSCSATAIATRPPIEWPTRTACRTPREPSAFRTASACPSMPYAAVSRGASDPPCPTRSMAITRWPSSAGATRSHHSTDAEYPWSSTTARSPEGPDSLMLRSGPSSSSTRPPSNASAGRVVLDTRSAFTASAATTTTIAIAMTRHFMGRTLPVTPRSAPTVFRVRRRITRDAVETTRHANPAACGASPRRPRRPGR